MKMESNVGSNPVGKWLTTGNQRSYRVEMNQTTLTLMTSSAGSAEITLSYSPGGNIFALGQWYHIAATKSGTAAKLYINGREVASGTLSSATIFNGTGAFTIGAIANPANYFDGLLKDVRVFNDARTQAEIVADAHTENVSDANLVGEWNLNNAYTDSSGNGNTLTPTNTPVFSTDFPWDAPAGADGSSHLETNLISWWTLDEASGTREDAHGSNDLADNNTVAGAAGKINNGADFELSNSEYLSIADASQSGLDISGSFSFSMWLKLEQLPSTAGTQFGLFSKYLATGDLRAYEAYILPSADGASAADGVEIVVSADGTTANIDAKGMAAALFAGGDVGNWVHIVLTYNLSTRTFRAYKNGIEQLTSTRASSGTIGSIFNNARPFELGRNNESAGTYFDGMMDEVAVYSRVLDYGDVLDLYNAGAGISYLGVQTFDQAVTANVSVSASIIKGMSKTLTATTTPSASVVKQMAKSLVATATATANMVKQMSQTLIATATVTAAMTAMKVFLQALTATVNVTASIAKTPGKLLTATSTVTASVAKSLSIVRTLVATASVTGIVLKRMSKTLVATTAITAVVTKTPGKLIRATANVTASVARSVAKVLVADVTVSATIDAGRAVIMIATATVTAVITKTPGKLLTAVASIIAKVSAPFWRTKYPAHGDGEDYEIKYPHE